MTGAWLSPNLADDGELVVMALVGEPEPYMGRWSASDGAFIADDGCTVEIERVAGIMLVPELPAACRSAA